MQEQIDNEEYFDNSDIPSKKMYKTAFNLNLVLIALCIFITALAYKLNIMELVMFFSMFSVVLLMILPACSNKN